MSDRSEIDARPAKRARLDDSTSTTGVTETPAPAPQIAPVVPHATPTAIDEDLERERRAGITEYVCPNNLGFIGVLKRRYTDFLVNEIGLDGQVVHLKSTQVPRKENTKTNGKQPNGQGTKTEDVGDGQILNKEEKGNGDVATVQTETVKAESAPYADSAQDDGLKEQAKQEQEEQLSEDDRNTLHSIFGEETVRQITRLVGQIRRREERKAKDFRPVIAPPITDKETRTQAHQSLRRIFPNLLESSMEPDQSIRIKATPPAERKGRKARGSNKDRGEQDASRKRGQLAWEENGGEYLHFTLYKENKDTMEIVGFLGSKLNSGTKAFGFAGTKDRRACTAQRACVKRQTAERMQNFNKILYNAAIGDWEYQRHNLALGDLKGNEFIVTLRDCHFEGEEGMDLAQRHELAKSVVHKAMEDFSSKGFINYYGLQRFGSFAASTDVIGRKMLQDDLKGAVEDILAYSDVALAAAEGRLPQDSKVLVSQDDRNRAKALHVWKTEGKANAALDFLPRKFNAERNIIQHLSSRNSRNGQHDRKSDWQGALMTIPRTLRLMYVHAYQSLVWNVVAGKRWTTYGDRVVEGDLVLVHEHREKEVNKVEVKKHEIDDDGEMVINPTGSENADAAAAGFERARALTKEEAESGLYEIRDIVLPQPGYDVEYPKNDIGEFYKDFMGSEKGGGLDPNNMRRSWREVSLSGGYRKFLARPLQPLSFEVHQYTRPDEQFVETDLQRVRMAEREKSGPPPKNDNSAKKENEAQNDVEIEDGQEHEVEEETKLAVVLKLQLDASAQAHHKQ